MKSAAYLRLSLALIGVVCALVYLFAHRAVVLREARPVAPTTVSRPTASVVAVNAPILTAQVTKRGCEGFSVSIPVFVRDESTLPENNTLELASKVGNSTDGRIKRRSNRGGVARYELQPKNDPFFNAGNDSLAITLSADGPTALDRLPDYEPRQARFPQKQGGIYYRLMVGDQVVFWGQTGSPGVVSTTAPESVSDADYSRVKSSLASQSVAQIQIPPTSQKAELRVWSVNYDTDLSGDLGKPLYSIEVPASHTGY